MSALADVGYTWQTWGGAWNPGDAIHFELPGASEQAKQLGAQEETHSLRDWILQLYGEIPWYVSILLPMATTTQSADVPYTAAQAAKILKKAGLS